MEILTQSARETQEFGKSFADRLKGGEVLALQGELGSGKTTFVQGLAQGLGVSSRIISPTFVLMRDYSGRGGRKFYHVDLYRLESCPVEELENIGITDIWEKGKNIVAIEWAEKVKKVIPKGAIWIVFTQENDKRKIVVEEK